MAVEDSEVTPFVTKSLHVHSNRVTILFTILWSEHVYDISKPCFFTMLCKLLHVTINEIYHHVVAPLIVWRYHSLVWFSMSYNNANLIDMMSIHHNSYLPDGSVS